MHMGRAIAEGGRAERQEELRHMYDVLRVYYQHIDDAPEPYRTQSLTAVRAVLRVLERRQIRNQ